MNPIAIKQELIAGGLEESLLRVFPSGNSSTVVGSYVGKKINFEVSKDYSYALVSLQKENPKVVDAFTMLMEACPFVKYQEPQKGVIVFEWEKSIPNRRYRVLEKKKKVGLMRV